MMIQLERAERVVIISLIALLLTASAVSACIKLRPLHKPCVEKFDISSCKSANSADFLFEKKININCAKVEDLMKIKGIGKNTAKRIVEYRYYNGSYSSIYDIRNIKGVSASLFERIKNRITTE